MSQIPSKGYQQKEYKEFADEEEPKPYQHHQKTEKEREEEFKQEREIVEEKKEEEKIPVTIDYQYDSFDTFLFYSLFVLKKWFVFTLLKPDLDIKNPQELFQKTKNFLWSKDDNWFKRFMTILVMIPVVLILLIYAILISLILLIICLVCLLIFVLFIDLPFWIVLAIQLTLLLLIVYYRETPSCQSLNDLFLVSGIWYTSLIWMLLFIGLMLFEYNDLGNSIIFIATYYRNKKIGSKFLLWFYVLFSCFPQFVQFLITSYSAWVSVSLIFANDTYLDSFSHFAGLFVILQVDSFIMEFIKISHLYIPASLVFSELEKWKREERKKEAGALGKTESQISRELNLAGSQVAGKAYTWDQIHFTTRTIEKFFGLKHDTETKHFLYDPKLDENDEESKYTGKRLYYLKYSIMVMGMAFIIYNFINYVVVVNCDCPAVTA